MNEWKPGVIAGIVVAIIAVIWFLQRPRATTTIDYTADGTAAGNAATGAQQLLSGITAPTPGDYVEYQGINGPVRVTYQPDAPGNASPFYSWKPGDPFRRLA